MERQGARGKGQDVGSHGDAPKAYLSEIFSSIQGEGLLVGLRQIFIRFSGCSLTCDYCDTQESRVRGSECKITGARGKGQGVKNFHSIPNPVSSEKLTEIVNSFQTHPNLHHSISITGGEPLEQVDFLKVWLPAIKGEMGKRRGGEGEKKRADSPIHRFTDLPNIYLETNGILHSHLSEVIDLIDIIGMDIKLPSVAGVKPVWDLHSNFLKIASKKEVFVKVVVSRNVTDDDMMQAISLVDSMNPSIPFIIQPRTPLDMKDYELLRLQEIASRKLSEVRVIPQVHKFLNLK